MSKISTYTDGVTANGTDKIPIARSGTNRYITPAYLATYIGGGGGGAALLARYHLSADASFADGGTSTLINFDTMDYDPDTLVTTGGSWHFTAPATAWYDVRIVNGFVYANGNTYAAGVGIGIELYTSATPFFWGSMIYHEAQTTTSSSYNFFVGGSLACSMTLGDTMNVKFFNFSNHTRKLATDSALEIYQVTT